MSDAFLNRVRNREFRLALFDLDGTLVDSARDLADAVDHAMQQLGYAAPGESRVRQWVGNGAPVLVRRALAHALGLTSIEEVPDEWFESAHDLFSAYYQEHFADRTVLYPGTLELLQNWQQAGIKLGLVTSKPEQFTGPLCAHLRIGGFFDIMLSGDSLPTRKPDPGPLLYACDKLEADIADTIMIGDSINDLRAARQANIPAICVSYGYNHGENICDAGPDLLVDSLWELL